jgi:Mg/Co/Ni transporter MgtE
MSTTVSNKYKNIIKKLRKNNTSANYIGNRKKDNYFKFLKYEEYDEVNDEHDEKNLKQLESKVSGEKYKIVFNDLPQDTINNILEYLPYQKRIAILKHKYNTKFIKKTLTKIPETTEDPYKNVELRKNS